MQKVDAHVDLTAALSEQARLRALGNDEADSAAKAAVRRHPVGQAGRRERWGRAWADACATARLIAVLAPLWLVARQPGRARAVRAPPSAEEVEWREQQRARKAEEARLAAERRAGNWTSHAWGFVGGVRRCMSCLVRADHRGGAEAMHCQGDRGWSILGGPAASTHELFVAVVRRTDEDPSPLFLCVRCGCWAETGVSQGLLRECSRGFASKSAKGAVDRIRQGLHPKFGAAARGGVVDDLSPCPKQSG